MQPPVQPAVLPASDASALSKLNSWRLLKLIKIKSARSRLHRSRFLQVNTRWKALAEIYTMHFFAPFWNRIPKNEENHGGGKRSWSNPGKTGQEKLISSRNSLPSATLARDLNKGRVTSLCTVRKAQIVVEKSLKMLPNFANFFCQTSC